jgi:hypothetical protein
MRPRREQTAYHEAGHAVASLHFRFQLETVTIVVNEEENSRGSCLGEGPTLESEDAEGIVVLYAGAAAQRRFEPVCDLASAGSDDDEADELLRFHPELKEDELRERAETFIVDHWAEVEAVANALLAENTLKGEEVEVIVDAVVEGKDWQSALAVYRCVRESKPGDPCTLPIW